MKLQLSAILTCILLLSGCATTNQHVLEAGDESQLQKRSYQSRIFETARTKVHMHFGTARNLILVISYNLEQRFLCKSNQERQLEN